MLIREMRSESKIICLEKVVKTIICRIFTVIIGYLLIASVFSTVYVADVEYIVDMATKQLGINGEHVYYIRDHALVHIIVFLAFSVVCIFLSEPIKKVKDNKWITVILCICVGIVCAAIVYVSQCILGSDQKKIFEIAMALRQGTHTELGVGGYLYIYPHQMGIALFYFLLSFLIGEGNYIGAQMANTIFIALTFYILCKISDMMQDKTRNFTAIANFMFLPYLIYATYIYGTVVGLLFAVFAFYMVLLFNKQQRILYLILGSISMMIAVILKSNFLIFFIAAAIYLLSNSVFVWKHNREKAIKNTLFLLVFIIFQLVGSRAMDMYIQNNNNGNPIQGTPMLTFVAMGLQEGIRGAGWHNGYDRDQYIENEYDYEKTAKQAKEDIEKTIETYSQDISIMINFFSKKINSQWNNPVFQSLGFFKLSERQDSVRFLLEGKGRYIVTFYMNVFQTWIYVGAFLYSIFRYKKCSFTELLLPITFIGGFLFHLFWEAKSIYATMFFLLLIPVCVCGYRDWISWLYDRKQEIKQLGWKNERCLKTGKIAIVAVAIVSTICLLSYTDTFQNIFARSDDTGIFNTYTQEKVNIDAAYME